ncbi:hypothetical protein B0J13DRAFT_525555 [Dactylonectria estremocensis]|uniref:Rhodopsin domain-containing protein n=1 Tax=Dactylonectria estremocensis TaxID=1079267 RepID=A0A9P9ESJ2_9HYPO|nr:hypothetical protein B0J13DRAFT_525555 [Dactylonectria estremocensis]
MHGISGEALLAVEWSLLGIALCLILARLNLRLNHLGRRLVTSDGFILASFAAAVSHNAMDASLHRRGVYTSHMDLALTQLKAPPDERIIIFKIAFFMNIPFYLEMYLYKAALLALYYEIFARDSRKLRAALTCLSVYCAVGFITTMSLDAPCSTHCTTVADNLGWAFHFTAEVLIFLLPVIYISQTNMTRPQKLSAGFTFCVGFISISITIARWFVVQAVFTKDPTFTTAGLQCISEVFYVADGHSGLIVAILPSLRPYLRIWQGADLSSRPAEIVTKSQNAPEESTVDRNRHSSRRSSSRRSLNRNSA